MITTRQISTPEGLRKETMVNRTESVEGVKIDDKTMIDEDDRSSSLSDLGDGGANEDLDDAHRGSMNDSDANDTEAETERLEESPQKLRKHKRVVLSLSANAGDIGSSPPAMQGPIHETEITHQSYIAHDNVAVLPQVLGPGVANGDIDQVSDISSLEGSPEELSKVASPPTITSKKRKRPSPPPLDDREPRPISSILSSQKRRSGSNLAEQSANNTEETPRASPADDDDGNALVDTTALSDAGEDQGVTRQLVPSKAQKSKRGKRKGKKVKEDEIGKRLLSKGALEVAEDVIEEPNGTDGAYNHEEAVDLDDVHDDAEAEVIAKNEEERE